MNEPNWTLIRAQIRTVLDVLSADRFYKWEANDLNAMRGRISDLRWAVAKLADAIAEICPDAPDTGSQKTSR